MGRVDNLNPFLDSTLTLSKFTEVRVKFSLFDRDENRPAIKSKNLHRTLETKKAKGKLNQGMVERV